LRLNWKIMLHHLNIFLGFMASFLSGCGITRTSGPVECMYGVPQEILERNSARARVKVEPAPEADSIPQPAPAQKDTVQQEEIPVPDIPVCKYGPPGGDW